jgi:hypothetical protein
MLFGMGEQFVNTVPTEEELGITVRGVTWEEFRGYTDEQVRELQRALAATVLEDMDQEAACPPMTEEDHEAADAARWVTLGEALNFAQFVDWRRHGVPDRAVTLDELEGHLRFLVEERMVASMIAGEAMYGRLPPEYERLPEQARAATYSLFAYFNEFREPYEQLWVDDESLYDTIGLEAEEIAELIVRDILEPLGDNPAVNRTYLLSRPYYEYWLAGKYGPRPGELGQVEL